MARLGLYELLPHRTGEEGGTPAEFKANLKRKVKCIRNVGTYDRVVIAATRQRLRATTGATSTHGSMNNRPSRQNASLRKPSAAAAMPAVSPVSPTAPSPPSEETPKSIIDQGYAVEAGDHREPATLNSHGSAYAETASLPLQLTAVEDSASVQLALIEVLQSLAAHQLDPKRAGLLLYGLQVASANAKNVQVDANSIRSISYTKEGIPLATQEHGWDVEDIEEADRLAEEEEEEEED
jgi:hypothetical protein